MCLVHISPPRLRGTRTIGLVTVFDHKTTDMPLEARRSCPVWRIWQCLPSKTASPLRPCVLAGRKGIADLLPSSSTAQTGPAVTLVQKCASTGCKVWNKAVLLRLHKEELEAFKDETTTAAIQLVSARTSRFQF